jgi:hypothetical protein
MTSKRAFLLLTALLSLLITVAPARGEDSGGVTVPTFTQEPGGGVVAPVAPVAPVEPVVAPVEAGAAQETTPTTPGGEEQPPDGEQTETETTPDDGTGAPVDEEPQAGTGGESGGGLPTTGLELAAMSMIGLGLLMAGLALRPTSSWPPPRDRLSRSIRPR